MKILHPFLFFSIKYAGGTSDLMFKIAKAQHKKGLKPIILSGNYMFDNELREKLPNVEFKILNSYFNKLGFSIMPGLWRVLNNELSDIDIVHMHTFRTFQNVLIYFFCRYKKIPYVIDAHGAVPYYSEKVLLKKFFDLVLGRRILNNASALIGETEVGKQEYLSIEPSLGQEKLPILSPPFDTDEFLNLPKKGLFRSKFNIHENLKVISFLGRINEIKGNDFLIEGFAKLLKKRDDVFLVLIGGDDGHMDFCKSLVKKLDIENKVLFTGFIGGDEKNSALIDSDIVAQMSRAEQGAWAPFEAVLCGTPIIVTEDTGAGEDVKRVNAGEVVKFGNVDDLALKLCNILDNYEDALSKTKIAGDFINAKMSMDARCHEYTDIYLQAKDAT